MTHEEHGRNAGKGTGGDGSEMDGAIAPGRQITMKQNYTEKVVRDSGWLPTVVWHQAAAMGAGRHSQFQARRRHLCGPSSGFDVGFMGASALATDRGIRKIEDAN